MNGTAKRIRRLSSLSLFLVEWEWRKKSISFVAKNSMFHNTLDFIMGKSYPGRLQRTTHPPPSTLDLTSIRRTQACTLHIHEYIRSDRIICFMIIVRWHICGGTGKRTKKKSEAKLTKLHLNRSCVIGKCNEFRVNQIDTTRRSFVVYSLLGIGRFM